MRNKFEDWCYVCGELVEEEKGIAERIKRTPSDPTWSWGKGDTRWAVRHPNCPPPAKPDTEKIYREYINDFNQDHK